MESSWSRLYFNDIEVLFNTVKADVQAHEPARIQSLLDMSEFVISEPRCIE